MAQATAETLKKIEAVEHEKDERKSAETAVSLKAGRVKLETLLGQIEHRGAQGKSMTDRYRKAMAVDAEKENAKGIEGLYGWMKEQWQSAEASLSDITYALDRAVFKRALNAQDRSFLLSALVQTDAHDFLLEHNKVAQVIHEKIQRAERDRQEYDRMVNHPLVKGKKALKVDGREVRILPDEEFMKLSLPERRRRVGEWKEALRKAEGVKERSDETEGKTLDESYRSRLYKAEKEGIIGRKTVDAFLNRRPDGFLRQTLEVKKSYLDSFDAQMQRYKNLWKQVKDNLRPDSQKHMRALRDELGYRQLMAEYQFRESADRDANVSEYYGKLEEARTNPKKRWIGRHTLNAFMTAFREQPLRTQNEWNHKEVFAGQMERYRRLWEAIETDKKLPRDKKTTLREKQDMMGYTELNALYDHYRSGKTEDAAGAAKSMKAKRILQARVTNETVRQGIETFGQEVEKEPSRLQRMVHVFRRIVERGEEGSFNAAQFQKNVRKNRSEDATPASRLQGTQKPSPPETPAPKEHLEKAIEQQGYREFDVQTESGVSHRVQVSMNDKEGLRHLFARDHEDHVGDQIREGRNQITFAVRKTDSTTQELKWEEVRAAKEYLEEMERQGEQKPV